MKINGEPLNDQTLRKMRGLFASGVTVVTTAHEGQLRGVTASAFSSVSLDPPLVLVCIANESESKERIAESGIFAVNILSDEQEFLSERFAARAPLVNAHFDGVPYHTAITGSPILADSLAWYDCRVEATARRRRSHDLYRARGGGGVGGRGQAAASVFCESVSTPGELMACGQ